MGMDRNGTERNKTRRNGKDNTLTYYIYILFNATAVSRCSYYYLCVSLGYQMGRSDRWFRWRSRSLVVPALWFSARRDTTRRRCEREKCRIVILLPTTLLIQHTVNRFFHTMFSFFHCPLARVDMSNSSVSIVRVTSSWVR